MEEYPLVSIIIPVYNGENFLKEAIDSAVNQTYPNIEIIVVNDGSTDKTEEIALSYGNRIRYFRKENGGVSSALNCGLKKMQGKYFSWLSHDDMYYPDKILTQMDAIKKAPDEKCIVLCNYDYIDEHSDILSKKSKKYCGKKSAVWSWKYALHQLLRYGSINGCSLLIPKAAFEQCGLFDETLRFTQDGYMWTNLFLAGYSVSYVPTICVKSRIHKGQVTQQKQDLFHAECDLLSEKMIPRLSEITTSKDRFLFDYAKYNGKHNNERIVKNIQLQATYKQYSLCERIIGRMYLFFGKIRPFIRRAYYKIFRIIKAE